MNKLIFISIIIFNTVFCFGQTNKTPENPLPNKWEIGLAYNSVDAQINQALMDTWVYAAVNYYDNFGNKNNRSFSLSLIPKYKLKSEDLQIRCEFGFSRIKLVSYYTGANDVNSPGFNTTAYDTIQQKIYRFCLGIQYSLIKKNELNFIPVSMPTI